MKKIKNIVAIASFIFIASFSNALANSYCDINGVFLECFNDTMGVYNILDDSFNIIGSSNYESWVSIYHSGVGNSFTSNTVYLNTIIGGYLQFGNDWYRFDDIGLVTISKSSISDPTLNIASPTFFTNVEPLLNTLPANLASTTAVTLGNMWEVLILISGTIMAFYVIMKIQDLIQSETKKKDKQINRKV